MTLRPVSSWRMVVGVCTLATLRFRRLGNEHWRGVNLRFPDYIREVASWDSPEFITQNTSHSQALAFIGVAPGHCGQPSHF